MLSTGRDVVEVSVCVLVCQESGSDMKDASPESGGV